MPEKIIGNVDSGITVSMLNLAKAIDINNSVQCGVFVNGKDYIVMVLDDLGEDEWYLIDSESLGGFLADIRDVLSEKSTSAIIKFVNGKMDYEDSRNDKVLSEALATLLHTKCWCLRSMDIGEEYLISLYTCLEARRDNSEGTELLVPEKFKLNRYACSDLASYSSSILRGSGKCLYLDTDSESYRVSECKGIDYDAASEAAVYMVQSFEDKYQSAVTDSNELYDMEFMVDELCDCASKIKTSFTKELYSSDKGFRDALNTMLAWDGSFGIIYEGNGLYRVVYLDY